MNILIVEDHKSYLEGIESYLNNYYKGTSKIHTASNGEEALSVLNGSKKIELIITDLNLPKKNGFELIEAIRDRLANIPIIVLTMYYNKPIIERLKLLKTNGFLTKNVSIKEIPLAIEEVVNNKVYITSELINLYQNYDFETSNVNYKSDNFSKKFSLTLRELEVVELLLESKPNTEIAQVMEISSETVKSHRKNIYLKLGVNNILDLYKVLHTQNFKKNND